MVAVGKAAQMRGVKKCHFISVEGDATHCQWIVEHFRDNGFDPAEHTMIHGVAGAADGFAEFPVVDDPAEVYGSVATYDRLTLKSRINTLLKSRIKALLGRQSAPEEATGTKRLRCVSIKTLLASARKGSTEFVLVADVVPP